MSRKAIKKESRMQVDPKYKSDVVSKFITRMMLKGKKSVSTRILYRVLDIVEEKLNEDGLKVFLKAINNVKPNVEVKSRRVGGSTYQVPIEIRESRRNALAIRWIIQFARARKGQSMINKLSAELIDAYNSNGSAFKKKEDTHRMAEANKAFAHYRW
jgi:small subunit ribosomal protein S7